MCQEDGLLAVQNGAQVIWVSNGSSQNDGFTATATDVLESIATAVRKVKPKVEVFVDSSIERGTDVMKCIALGADGVFVSRPIMWSLSM